MLEGRSWAIADWRWQEWIGPDARLEGLSGEPTEWSRVATGPGTVVGVWATSRLAPSLGDFGRLRALKCIASGMALPLYYSLQPFLKLVTYVPRSHVARVRAALGDAGAGHIGGYSHCTFTSFGVGTFMAPAGAEPFIGRPGHRQRVSEARLETIVPRWRQAYVAKILNEVHPYEEVAVDWIPLDNHLTIAKAYDDNKTWICAAVDDQILVAALKLRPRAVQAERVPWRARLALAAADIACDLAQPGELLGAGLQQMGAMRRAPWE